MCVCLSCVCLSVSGCVSLCVDCQPWRLYLRYHAPYFWNRLLLLTNSASLIGQQASWILCFCLLSTGLQTCTTVPCFKGIELGSSCLCDGCLPTKPSSQLLSLFLPISSEMIFEKPLVYLFLETRTLPLLWFTSKCCGFNPINSIDINFAVLIAFSRFLGCLLGNWYLLVPVLACSSFQVPRVQQALGTTVWSLCSKQDKENDSARAPPCALIVLCILWLEKPQRTKHQLGGFHCLPLSSHQT